MLRLRLYFRCGQSQELAPRESPQIIHLRQQQFCHHLWGALRRWQYDSYNNISQVATTTTFYDGTNPRGIRYTTFEYIFNHYTTYISIWYTAFHSLDTQYMSFWYIHAVHDIQQSLYTIAIYVLHANGIQLLLHWYHQSFTFSFFTGALPAETPTKVVFLISMH